MNATLSTRGILQAKIVTVTGCASVPTPPIMSVGTGSMALARKAVALANLEAHVSLKL
jgi:hypothetical protein